MKNQEVIKYACALTGNKEGLLEFVYTLLIEYILKQTDISKHMFDSEAHFLKSMIKEVSNSTSIVPLHNKYINYITQGDIKIFIPSKLFIFGPATYKQDEVEYIKEQLSASQDMLHAECVMKLGSSDRGHVEYATEVLKILQYIKGATHQHISIAHLDWKNISLSNEVSIRQLAFETLKISQNLTSICMWTCKLPPPIYDHIVSQLQRCDNLQRLDLSECHSVDIGKAIAVSKSLSDLYLYDSVLSSDAYKYVANGLRKHHRMKRLHLNRTHGIPLEMADAIREMKSLQVFRAKQCKMSVAQAEQIMKSLANCYNLQKLHLGLNTLTGCIPHLFPRQSHPGFAFLKSLWINGVYLNKQDVEALSYAFRANKLPQLQLLDLSFNNELGGRINGLFHGEGHPGFQNLTILNLQQIPLTGNDLVSIADTVKQGRIPKFRKLVLNKICLSAMEPQITMLVQNCISSYKKLNVPVQVFETDLSETFVSELQYICDGSVVNVKNAKW